jgi:hypothetical protein
MDNCWSVTQSGGNEISKIGVDWFFAVLETAKKKVGAWPRSGRACTPPPRPQPRSATAYSTCPGDEPELRDNASGARISDTGTHTDFRRNVLVSFAKPFFF